MRKIKKRVPFDQAGSMGEQVAEGDVFFSAGIKSGNLLSNGIVYFDKSSIHQQHN